MPKPIKKEYDETYKLTYNKIYYQKNREKLLQYRHDYCQTNKEKVAISQLKWQRNNRSYLKKYRREYYLKNRGKAIARIKSHLELHPEKKIAYRNSTHLKPNTVICSVCKNNRKLCKHHDDYSKPKEVTWVCYECHSDLHKNMRIKANERP